MEIDVPLVAARWLHFLSLMVVFGASLFPLYAVPARLGATSLPGLARTGRAVRLAAYLALASVLAWVCRSLVIMVGDIDGVFDRDTLSGFFLETSFGPVWLARLFLLLVMAILATSRSEGRGRATLLAGLGAGALASQAWIGHAAMASGTELSAELACYMVHVLTAGAWIGGLVPLGLWLAARPRADLATDHAVLLRFSNAAVIFVLLILASGIANSIFRLGSARDLAMTAYGWTILAKGLLFAMMLIAAAFNRWRLMPRMDKRGIEAIAAIRRNILVEEVLAGLVLAAAALLGTLPPQA
ncbi:putative copper resistance protein D [Rhizobiales bacterium GAS188]|jgi:putative copper resistance protein D|nr:putative copper resistance protein D [Rhizobiales bacterium GAS188]